MPTWRGILNELKKKKDKGSKTPYDSIRRRYLYKLNEFTERDTIIYATKWTQASINISPQLISITEDDIQGLMEVIHGLDGKELDLIIHSPGGSAEVTESFVKYLRTKYDYIRAIIPQGAMSAATMLACAADKIVMGKHSYLGPIDSQIILSTPLGVSSIPAQAILDQFDKASAECKEDSKNMGVWMPILGQYGPALLIQCQNALDLSKDLVATFLNDYMFKDSENKDEISKDIAEKLADHSTYKSHGRHIDRDQAEALGLIIEHLEDDQTFQDLVLSLFHATTHTFDGTTAIKIIENHKGKAYIKQVTPIIIQQQEKEEKKKK